tara:strand:- start:26115 stop:27575 length:1461 start_codon:yes stop_codon:yes gene_type:complete
MTNFNSFFKILLALIVLSSCKTDGESVNSKDALSSFLNENDQIVTFGKADLKGILAKADYSNVPKVGNLIDDELSTLEKVIDFNSSAYYAMEGPFDRNGNATATYAFFQLIDEKEFDSELTKKGYDIVEKDGIQIAEDENYAFGYKNKLVILIKSSSDANYSDLLTAAFKSSGGDLSGGKIDEILRQEGDVVLGMNVQSLYNTSNTDLTKLSKAKQDELDAMVKDSYIQTIIKFEDGAGIIETKNYFSDALKSRMFFNSDESAPVLKKLGGGTPRAGLSVNLDMKKMQSFMNDYSPETIDELSAQMGSTVQTALMFAGKDKLAALFNGQLGFLMIGEPGENGSMIPDFNAYLGVTKRGRGIADFLSELIPEEFAQMATDENGMTIRTISEFSEHTDDQNLILPEGAENFGRSSVSFFINLDGLDLDNFDLEKGQKVAKIVKYITFDYDENGGRLYIKAKKGQENVLKQAMDVLIEEFETEVSKMSI